MPVTYVTEEKSTYKVEGKHKDLLANFEAEIVEELHYVDGLSNHTHLRIAGRNQAGEFPIVTIPAEDYQGLGWVMPRWGIHAIVSPGGGVKDDLRTAIQTRSRPKKTTIYKHVGWTTINDERAYVHAKGAIKKTGNDDTVRVELPQEISRYDLSSSSAPKAAVQATLALALTGPPTIAWPLFAATFAPLFGPVDFAIHLTGRTGTYKSELISLWQSHYGATMDARHLPASWSSTANALEAQAFLVANAPLTVDDFVPTGTSWQQRAYQTTADKLIRGQGNQAGRARLSDQLSLNGAMYPRGIILSTGEDIPEGHSIRARMLILELAPGDILPDTLTRAQAARNKYPATTHHLIRHLIENPADLTKQKLEIRNDLAGVGHTRTPSTAATLIAVCDQVLAWMKEKGHLSSDKFSILAPAAKTAIIEAAKLQSAHLEQADPVDTFTAAFRAVVALNLAHIRKLNNGIPLAATTLGWTTENDDDDDGQAMYKPHGPCMGWIDAKNDLLYLDINSGYNIVRKNMATCQLTKGTLLKRLKEAGLIVRADDARQRNTIRITASGHPRHVLALSYSKTTKATDDL